MKNYYKVLGISPEANKEEIEAAYEIASRDPELIMDNHEKQLRRKAYETLIDAEKRKLYDETYIKFVTQVQTLKRSIGSLKSQQNNFSPIKRDILNDETIQCLEDLSCKLLSRSSALTDAEDWAILVNMIELIPDLMTASDQDCKQVIFDYGIKMREMFQHIQVYHFVEKYKSYSDYDTLKPLKLINDILVHSLNYKIVELELFQLDKEIERIEDVAKQTKSPYHFKFANSLRDQKTNFKNDIQIQCENHKNWAWENHIVHRTPAEIKNSKAVTLITDTTETLQQLEYTNQSKKRDKQHLLDFAVKYEQKAKEIPHAKNFLKSVATIVVSGLSAILSIPFALIGCICGGGSTGIIALALPVAAAQGTSDMCKKLMGLPPDVSLSQHLLLKNLSYDAAQSAKKWADFIDPKNQNDAHERQVNEAEVLAHYFALR